MPSGDVWNNVCLILMIVSGWWGYFSYLYSNFLKIMCHFYKNKPNSFVDCIEEYLKGSKMQIGVGEIVWFNEKVQKKGYTILS